MADENPNGTGVFLESKLVRAEAKITFLDRFRILFGSRLFVNVRVDMQRRQKIRTASKYGVEAIFGQRVRRDEIPILFDGFEETEGLLHD